jgi:hypothetical protein
MDQFTEMFQIKNKLKAINTIKMIRLLAMILFVAHFFSLVHIFMNTVERFNDIDMTWFNKIGEDIG